MKRIRYEFEWDPKKARTNIAKHGLNFERAATVFLDPLAITIPDEEHSDFEPRWITLGKSGVDAYLSTQTYHGGNPKLRGPMMKRGYDFSKGERGKYFNADAELRTPIYLEVEVPTYLTERAAEKGVPLTEMVNGLLKQEIQIIESVK